MIVSFNEAQIIQDEHGKRFLKLELIAHVPGMKTIILSTFPATSNFDPLELSQVATDIMPSLTSKVQENDADLSDRLKDS